MPILIELMGSFRSQLIFKIAVHILLSPMMQAEGLNSFLDVSPDSEFPLENIPFGAASLKDSPQNIFLATRVGTQTIIQETG